MRYQRVFFGFRACVGLALAATLSVSAMATERSAWRMQAISQSTGYTVAGQMVGHHQFGMLKHSNICGNDELYLIWSSNESNVWGLSGKRVNILAEFDGTPLEMPLEVVSIRELSNDQHQIMFAHVYANEAVIDLIGRSQRVDISMPTEDPALASVFSITRDSFALGGFLQARSAAQQRCNGFSDKVASAGPYHH